MEEYEGIADSSTGHENMEVDKRQQYESPPWSQLPPLITEVVYSYLDRKDQRCMSLVCRNWQKEYSSPGIWRRFKLSFPCLENDAELNDVNLAKRFGAWFRHLDIVFVGRIRRRHLDSILTRLKLFLEAVASHSQLLSISFTDMHSYLKRLDDTVLEEVRQALVNCFQSQNKLRSVHFSNSRFGESDAAEILKVILANNSATLRFLLLTGFVDEFSEDESVGAVDEHLNFLTLMNLRVWKMEYSRIFENMVLSFYEYRNNVDMRRRKGHLTEIELFVDGDFTDDYLKIHPNAWEYFSTIFPDLRISMTFQSASEPRNLDFFIVPHMPLRALDFQWNNVLGNESVSEIGPLLTYIAACGINKSLEVLRIVWRRNSLNLVPDLIGFTGVCPALKILQLYIQHPVQSLDVLFNSWLEKRPPSLELVQITIAFVDDVGEMFYTSLNDFYAPLLQSLDLSLILLFN